MLSLLTIYYSLVILLDPTIAVSSDNVAVLFANATTCSNIKASERDLRIRLFENYSNIDRPRKDPKKPVNVTFSLVLESIKDVIVQEHSITVSGYLYVNWYDDYLAWAHFPEFSCISLLVLPASSLWLPDIAMMNVPEKYALFKAKGEKVRLYDDGYVHFRPGGLFSAVCELDLTYFPYDEQMCQLRFQSWLYLKSYMSIQLDVNPVVQSRWTENEEWELINASAKVVDVFYSNPTHPYDGVYFTLILRRRVGFFIMNVIIPGTIISLVEAVTFTLDSGEPIKIHISFTCLLAFQVFQLMVIPEMPQSSMNTPLLCIYIILEMAYIGMVLLGQGFVFLLLHHSNQNKSPPKWMLKVAKYMAGILKVKCKADLSHIRSFNKLKNTADLFSSDGTKLVSLFDVLDHNDSLFDSSCSIQNKVANQSENYDRLLSSQSKSRRKNAEERNRQQWAFLVAVVDRFVVCVYLLCVTVTPFFMFLVIPAAKFKSIRVLR